MIPAPLLMKMQMVRASIEHDFLLMGGLIRKARETASFEEISDALRYSKRKVYALAACYDVVQSRKLTKRDAIDIGWAKMTMIGPERLVGPERELWVKRGKYETSATLANIIRGSDDSRRFMEPFYLTTAQRDRLHQALIKFGAKRKGRALLYREQALLEILNHVERIRDPVLANAMVLLG